MLHISVTLSALVQVQRDYEELPAGTALSLRDSLVTLLVKHCQGNAAVRTQLCLAIAALAAHLPAVQWGPQGVVGWLAQRLGSESQAISLPCMLELLTVLPQVGWLVGAEVRRGQGCMLLTGTAAEESELGMRLPGFRCLHAAMQCCHVRCASRPGSTRCPPTPPYPHRRRPQEASSYQPAVRPERRRQVMDEMLAYAPQALQILGSCLAAPLPRAREQVLDAFTAWLKLTGGIGLSGPMLMQSPLVRSACCAGCWACCAGRWVCVVWRGLGWADGFGQGFHPFTHNPLYLCRAGRRWRACGPRKPSFPR